MKETCPPSSPDCEEVESASRLTALLAGGFEFDLCSVMKQTTQVASVL